MDNGQSRIDREHLYDLLLGASRTFAINIPMMPDVLRDSLTLGYLLLRNADTLEDAYRWPKAKRISGLESLHTLMIEPDEELAQRFAKQYKGETGIDNPKHLELLQLTPYLLAQLEILPPDFANEVRSHVARVIRRMQSWVANHDDDSRLTLTRLKELDDYCYSVAGIVGELCTTLILLYKPEMETTRGPILRTLETACGAGLQLTNIIKDVFRDHLEGRYYIPREYLPFDDGGSAMRLMPILAYAYRYLCLGRDYVCALPEEDPTIRRAVLVPLMFAVATLVRLMEGLEDLIQGVDVKITREDVVAILGMAEDAVLSNQRVHQAWKTLSGPLSDLNMASLLAASS